MLTYLWKYRFEVRTIISVTSTYILFTYACNRALANNFYMHSWSSRIFTGEHLRVASRPQHIFVRRVQNYIEVSIPIIVKVMCPYYSTSYCDALIYYSKSGFFWGKYKFA